MTQTTSAQVKDIFDRACALTAWDQSLLAELYPLLEEPFETFYSWTLAPYQPGVVTDNLYRLKPRGWSRNEQDLGPKSDGSPQGSVAGFSLWKYDTAEKMWGLTTEMYSGQTHPTIAVAMLAATAKVWYEILEAAGR
jgi:hypothetical protein